MNRSSNLEICLNNYDRFHEDFKLHNFEGLPTIYDQLHNLLQYRPDRYARWLKKQQKKELTRSLTTLISNVLQRKISSTEINKVLEATKEDTYCARSMLTYVSKLMEVNLNEITNSYLDLMEQYVMSTSIEKPPAFKGDLASLVLEVGSFTNPKLYQRNLKLSNSLNSVKHDKTSSHLINVL